MTLLLAFSSATAGAQITTVTWHRQAFGQTIECPGRPGVYFGWPNNNNWSQSLVIGDPCSEGDSLVTQPSNWSIPTAPNGINYNVILGSQGGAPANLDMSVTLNQLVIQPDGGLTMTAGATLTATTLELQNDTPITYSFGGGGWPVVYLPADGLLHKSAGTGTNALGVTFVSRGGTIQVDSGTLSLSTGGGVSNGTFIVGLGAVLDPTGGTSPTWEGQLTGSGAGKLLMNGGTINANPWLTLNFPVDFFQWTGGWMGGIISNVNVVTVSGSNGVVLSGVLYNYSLLRQTNTAGLGFYAGTHVENLTGGTHELAGDENMYYCCGGGGWPWYDNFGLLRKSSGAGTSSISIYFNNHAGTVQVDSGTLSLNSAGYSSNGTFILASGAVLDPTDGSSPTWAGEFTGSGAGKVLLNSGTLNANPNVTLNFPVGLFQWTGGQLAGTTINSNVVTVAGTNSVLLSGQLLNYALFRQTNTVNVGLWAGTDLENLAGATYEFAGDGGVSYCCGGGGSPNFGNRGLVRKSGGSGNSSISIYFNNLGGTLQVDSGTLSLSGAGSSSNGTFIVASGAVLDLTGGSSPTWAGQMAGSGAGTVLMSGGTVNANPSLTLDFPPGVFQWTGGWLAGAIVNSNTVTISSTNGVGLSGVLYNYGVVRQTNTAGMGLWAGAHIENMAGGTYELAGSGGLGYCCGGGGSPWFNNFGLVRRSSGTGTVTLDLFSNRGGSIEVDCGLLSLNGAAYTQGGGALTIKLGGRGAGESGQLATGAATLGGPLDVSLASGFVPAAGDQFQILSCSSLSGAFTSTNVPAGVSVNNSNNGVFLVVNGPAPVQIINPALSGGNLTFSMATVNGRSYAVQQNTNLGTTNWIFCTNFTGNGLLMQVVVPTAGAPRRFYRVSEP
jgi:hypothetical protein